MEHLKFRQFNLAMNHFHYWGYLKGDFIPPLNNILTVSSDRFTQLKVGDFNLWENDIVQTPYGLCVIYWSTLFNGWCLLHTINRTEIPIGEYGISVTEIMEIKGTTHTFKQQVLN